MAPIKEEIFYSLVIRRLFPKKQKGCHKGISGTGDLQYFD